MAGKRRMRAIFAELAGVPRARVRIVPGATARLKVVEVEGMEQGALETLLENFASEASQ